MKQRLIMWLAVVAGVVLVLAVAWAAILWTRPEPIRIAFANSLSGPSAPAETESLVATQLAIDEVNAKGGVNGRPISSNPCPADRRSDASGMRCRLSPAADVPSHTSGGTYGPIVLQNSFWTTEDKFSGLWARPSNDRAGDHRNS